MSSEDQPIENLLRQMRLNQPSRSLDQAVHKICDEQADTVDPFVACERKTEPLNRSWLKLIPVMLVASLVGFFVGQFIHLGSLGGDQGTAVGRLGKASPMMQAALTPVKFNLNAFQLLHRHSELPAYAKCKDCHSEDGPPQAFGDWYYGDMKFFEQHTKGDVSKCSDCHSIEPHPKDGPKEIPAQQFKHFQDSNCLSCHVAGKKTLPKPSLSDKITQTDG